MRAEVAHEHEPHREGIAQRLNWLRAGVLGANDGIVSVAAVVVGVAGATISTPTVVTAGLAALVGGAVSMALGEYVSVSSQRDSERAMIQQEKRELKEMPKEELDELVRIYEGKGLNPDTARTVAEELTRHDALGAHLEAELGLDPDDVVNPWHAALASAVSFLCGGILPLLTILLPPSIRVPVTFAAVLVALAITGATGAAIGGGRKRRAATRVVVGGALALGVTYALGTLLGTTGLV
jgi:VIT1/CCC1 family predicted Fe2+/Mn2+ transporter